MQSEPKVEPNPDGSDDDVASHKNMGNREAGFIRKDEQQPR